MPRLLSLRSSQSIVTKRMAPWQRKTRILVAPKAPGKNGVVPPCVHRSCEFHVFVVIARLCSSFQSNKTETLMLLISFFSFAPDSKQISLHWFQTELFAFLLLFYFCFDSFALNTTLRVAGLYFVL